MAIHGHDPPKDISVLMDIAVNPAIVARPCNCQFPLQRQNPETTQCNCLQRSNTLCYSARQMVALRRDSGVPCNEIIHYVKTIGIFRFRGKRGGKRSITTRITQRSEANFVK